MTSPLVRTWIAQRLPDYVDRLFCLFHPRVNAVWDDWTRKHGDLPLPAAATPGTPVPALNLLVPCKTCGARSNAPCVNLYGEPTGPHKSRRDAAASAADLSGVS